MNLSDGAMNELRDTNLGRHALKITDIEQGDTHTTVTTELHNQQVQVQVDNQSGHITSVEAETPPAPVEQGNIEQSAENQQELLQAPKIPVAPQPQETELPIMPLIPEESQQLPSGPEIPENIPDGQGAETLPDLPLPDATQ